MTRRFQPMASGLTSTLTAGLLLFACARPQAPAEHFTNKVWKVRESSSVEPGTLYAFLSEGTLVIASPHGKPSLGQWKQEGETLTLVEEGLPYRADVVSLKRDEFSIRVHNPGQAVEMTFAPADEPLP